MANILIVGAGTAGVTVAARLLREHDQHEVTLVAPDTEHFYQPLWTLVGGGLVAFERTRKPISEVLPRGVRHVQDQVVALEPDKNRVRTLGGDSLPYDALVLVPGLRIATEEVLGLDRALREDPRVWTNYLRAFVEKGPAAIEAFSSGNALFTFPRSPLKCGGAPQKIMWICEETLRHRGVREDASVQFWVPGDKIFGIPKYREVLDRIADERGIELKGHHHLIEVRHDAGLAVFENVDEGSEVEVPYGLLHVAPPSRAPDFVIDSPLSAPGGRVPESERSAGAQRRGLPQGGPGGFIEVDPRTTQHVRYPNVFAIGDASNLPTAKTGAAIRKQAPILVDNLCAFLEEQPLMSHYDGYTSCPLVMGHHSVMLAEFAYDGEVRETFPFDQAKPRYSMWLLKRYVLPLMYWHGMLRGRA